MVVHLIRPVHVFNAICLNIVLVWSRKLSTSDGFAKKFAAQQYKEFLDTSPHTEAQRTTGPYFALLVRQSTCIKCRPSRNIVLLVILNFTHRASLHSKRESQLSLRYFSQLRPPFLPAVDFLPSRTRFWTRFCSTSLLPRFVLEFLVKEKRERENTHPRVAITRLIFPVSKFVCTLPNFQRQFECREV